MSNESFSDFLKRKRSPLDIALTIFAALLIVNSLSFAFTPWEVNHPQPTEQTEVKKSETKQEKSNAAPAVVAATAAPKEEEAPAKELKIHFLDVGQGDSEFIELPDGKTVLIDAGEADQGQKVVSYISALGYKKIDYLVATHPHADHIGGLPQVLSSFEIGEVWAPKVSHNTKTFEGFLDAVAAKGLQIHAGSAGAQFGPNDQAYAFEMLAPSQSVSSDDMNDYSIVLRLKYGNETALFTGDAPSTALAGVGHADLLKVGHHGSKTSTDIGIASLIKPSYAIISYGLGNSYGHPTEQAISALKQVGAAIYGTAVNGNIIAYMTPDSLRVEPSQQAEVTPAEEKKEEAPAAAPAAPVAAAPAEPAPQQNERTVYVTATGKKYHIDPNCRTLKRSKTVTPTTESQAISQGLGPCKVCTV